MAYPGTFVTGQVLTAAEMNAINEGASARPLLTGGAYIDGTNGLVLSGLSGNNATSPDSAALSITGDIDIKCKVTMTDWTPSSSQTIVAKWFSNTERSYLFEVLTNGKLRLLGSSTGANLLNIGESTVATGVADGSTKWVRVTVDVDNGAGSRVVKFYLSDDGTTWSQLGTTQTIGAVVSFYDSTSQIEIGAHFNGGTSQMMTGTIGRVIIQSAYDTADNTTSVVFDADFEAEAADTLAFTEDSSNAATVSVTTTRYTYGAPGLQFASVGSGLQLTQNLAYFNPFVITDAIEVDMFYFEVTTGPASTAAVRAAIYETDDNFTPQGAAIVDFGEVTVPTSATGVFQKQITPVTLKPGAYMFAIVDNLTALYFRFYRGGISGATGAGGSNPLINTMTANAVLASFPQSGLTPSARLSTNVPPFWVGLFRWKAA